ncbi:MAG: flavodoxin family protein [Oscillospiraceae bacterium]|jgi:multimeric flavodoxin WrbA|nr:flavodoxin family protein [Oscillospiraceae bacterium]
MKVLLVNGSPNERGCTHAALAEVASALGKEGVDTELFWLGRGSISGCLACWRCRENGRCAIDDTVNVFRDKAEEACGFVFGAPVHYASPCGSLLSFMDRLFFSGGKVFCHKPAAAVVAARRAGTTAALDVINKYFTISQMPVVSSRYWNMVHGAEPEDARKDAEGLYTMRVLGRNMAYLLRCIEAGAKAGVPLPEEEPGVYTNFIRD